MNDKVERQAIFRDSMSFIVQHVVNDCDPSPVNVLMHMTKSIGEFIANQEGDGWVAAIWKGSGARFGVEWRLGSEPGPTVLKLDALATIERRAAEAATHLPYLPLLISKWGQPYHTFRLAPHSSPEDHVLELSFESSSPVEREQWEWLTWYARGLGDLYHTMRGLLVAQIGRAKESLKAELRSFHLSRDAPIEVNLQEALRIVPRLLDIGALDLVEELVVLLQLHIFGLGRRIRSVRREHATSMTRALIQQIRDYLRESSQATGVRLGKLVRCFEAAIAPDAVAQTTVADDTPELDLLSMWTGLYTLAIDAKTSTRTKATEAAWRAAHHATQRTLTQILQSPVEQHCLDNTRNWMTTWFCLELLREAPTTGPNLWELRSELAYVLRELLRARIFGARKDFFYDRDALVDSLANLVIRHATRIVGISTTYTSDLMVLIRRDGGDSRDSVTAHLQHLVDVYLAGHLLLSLKVKRAGDVQYAVQWIAGGYREDKPNRACRAAFSLAAMFHSIGHVFLPNEPRAVLTDVAGDPVVRALRDRVTSSQQLVGTITDECIDAIARHPYFDTETSRDAVLQQFRNQAADGCANHALLSAWYLHRMRERVRRMGREPEEVSEYARTAVRAILLHDAHTVQIDASRDPVAALLVLCNETFEWAPSRRRRTLSSPHDPGRPIERSAEILRLRIESQDLVLEAPPDGRWPEVAIELGPHEYADRPIVALWLRKAQAIGRIKPSESSGFAPTVRVRSYCNPDLAHWDLQTWEALQQALGNSRYPELAEWCEAAGRFRVFEKRNTRGADPIRMEEVRLRYLPEQLYDQDLDAVIPEVLGLFEDFLERPY